MRIEDAPPAGWYPDPEGGSRLRWWEGTDWADRWRAPPTRSEVDRRTLVSSFDHEDEAPGLGQLQDRVNAGAGMARRDSQAVVEQVRMAAREEAERAAQMFNAQARAVTRDLQPLITQYTSVFTRWFRIVAVIVIVVLMGWVAFQIFAQVSLFDWVGDRIDNLSNNVSDDNGAIPVPFR